MSTVKATNFNNAAASAGGLSIDTSGAVTGSAPWGGRNLLHNGAMQVAQRGTSRASISTNATELYFTADRWATLVSAAGTWTQTIEADAPTGSGLRNSIKTLCTTAQASLAAGAYLALMQRLEGQDVQRIAKGTTSAQQVTLSFWVKSNVTGTYIVEFRDIDNARSVSASYTISSSATWEQKKITFPADTTGVFDNDNAASVWLLHYMAAGSQFTSGTLQTAWATGTDANRAPGQTNLAASTNNYWQITGVQLEVGPVATPFEFKSYGQELAECQRYYQRRSATTYGALTANGQNGGSTTSASVMFPLFCALRSIPVAVTYSNVVLSDGTNLFTPSTIALSGAASAENVPISFTVTGLTTYRGYYASVDTSASGYLAVSADL